MASRSGTIVIMRKMAWCFPYFPSEVRAGTDYRLPSTGTGRKRVATAGSVGVPMKIVQIPNGYREKGTTYVKSPLSQLVELADSSFDDNKQYTYSGSGIVVVFAGGVVSLVSRAQHCVT